MRDARQVRRRIGYVPQLISADSALTARENLTLFAKLYGIPAADRQERIDEALVFMGLLAVSNALVRTYSGGMIRRLEIAQALLHRPAVVFLDEPTVGLDPAARHSVWERLRELRVRFGTTVLLTTHDMGGSKRALRARGHHASRTDRRLRHAHGPESRSRRGRHDGRRLHQAHSGNQRRTWTLPRHRSS